MGQKTQAVDVYLERIATVNLLTAEEEHDLAIKAQRGDDEARRRLIEANLRFVVKVAKGFMNQGLPFLDLIQEGNLGLMEAIERFDPQRGFRLTTYAAWWIRLSIQRALEQKARVVSMPINKIEKLRKLKSFTYSYTNQHGRDPSLDEMARGTGLEKDVVALVLQNETRVFSFDSPMVEEGVPMDRIHHDHLAPHPAEEIQSRDIRREVDDLMEVLTPKERTVIMKRYGLDETGESSSLRDVGKSIGMSAEGVRRIEKQALDKLRRPHIQERMRAAV